MRLADLDIINLISELYSDSSLLTYKRNIISDLITSLKPSQNDDLVLARCPGRISFSKHADYINSDLLYTLDDRDIFVLGLTRQKQNDYARIQVFNKGEYESFSLDASSMNFPKSHWAFYLQSILSEFALLENLDQDLYLSYHSDLPSGAGLSSSHALMLVSMKVLQKLFKINKTDFEIIHLCKKIENHRGFKSGLGDQSAQIFCKKNHLSFLKLFPKFEIKHQLLDPEIQIVLAPSFIKVDKSLPEFSQVNQNIVKYQTINELAKNFDCDFLADLNYRLNENEIGSFIKSIQDQSLQGLAVYGLAESSRLKFLKENFDYEFLGKHLSLSHRAEIQEQNFVFDDKQSLALQSGYYGASTSANNELQQLSIGFPGVLGSTITGAGFGGTNLILVKKAYAKELKNYLIQKYYKAKGLEHLALEDVHLSSSAQALSVHS